MNKYKSNNYRKEKVRTNDYSDKEWNDYLLCRYVAYGGEILKI